MVNKFVMPDGVERVYHDVSAADVLPGIMELYGYSKIFIICSKTLNTKTDIVEKIRASLGSKVIGVTDEVGEHAPVSNVLKGARLIQDSGADVLLTVGGGSVLDFAKFIQLALSEKAFTKDELLTRGASGISANGEDYLGVSKAEPVIRQIAIPTSLATADWTPAGTPVDDDTKLKVGLMAVRGAPQVIIYDPEILGRTPMRLLLSTGIRGLDHSINSLCVPSPHPFADILASHAVKLFIENLPRIKRDPTDREALTNCQLANWYVGVVVMTMAMQHGFSHALAHVVAPWADIAHSDVACVLMLTQAKWLEGLETSPHEKVTALLGRSGEKFSDILNDLLVELEMPTNLAQLGVTPEQTEEMIPHALAWGGVTKSNIRPVKTADDLRQVFKIALGT